MARGTRRQKVEDKVCVPPKPGEGSGDRAPTKAIRVTAENVPLADFRDEVNAKLDAILTALGMSQEDDE